MPTIYRGGQESKSPLMLRGVAEEDGKVVVVVMPVLDPGIHVLNHSP
jgi:hypothetical protein